MKQGRPKATNKAKNRIHSIVLTEKAEIIFREVCKKRQDKRWFNRYVSEHIVRDFENGSKAIMASILLELQNRKKVLDEKINLVTDKIFEIKREEHKKILKKELEPVGIRT